LSAVVANDNAKANQYALPFAWTPSYPATPCTVGGTCTVPGEYDLIVEADLGTGQGVQWIRYSLLGTTLMRAMVPKQPFQDPVGLTTESLTPYLENVMNGSNALPVFSYVCDGEPTQQPCNGGPTQLPSTIREVNISLMVRSLQPDLQTHQYRTITLNGQAMRLNPSQ
jgi:hypothetical protein